MKYYPLGYILINLLFQSFIVVFENDPPSLLCLEKQHDIETGQLKGIVVIDLVVSIPWRP